MRPFLARCFSRHSPDDIQIREHRTTFPPPRKLRPLCSQPLFSLYRIKVFGIVWLDLGQEPGHLEIADLVRHWLTALLISSRCLEPFKPQGKTIPIWLVLGAGRQVDCSPAQLLQCFEHRAVMLTEQPL